MTRPSGPFPPGDEAMDALIDAFLDGDMSPEQRRDFEAQTRANEALARELALQQRADESLRRQFQPPAAPAIAEPAGPAHAPPPRPARTLFRPTYPLGLYFAATVALGIAVSFGVYQLASGGKPVSATYHKLVDAGFKPEWVCENDEQFAQYTKDRFGAPWSFDKDPAITLVGWRYGEGLLSPDETVLLATSGGERIVVIADEASHDRRLRGSTELHVHRREAGGLVLYEISPLNHAAVIERIRPYEPGTK